MNKNYALFLVGTMGLLIGVMAGASTDHTAQTISLSGANPENVKYIENIRDYPVYRNSRNDVEGKNYTDGRLFRYTVVPNSGTRLHGAAQQNTNIRTQIEIPMECMYYNNVTGEYVPFTRTRLSRCLHSVENDLQWEMDNY